MKVLRTTALVALVTFCALGAQAGARFDITAEAPGYTYEGQISLEENQLRIDITAGNHPLFNPNISIIHREAGREVLVLDHASKTYFQRQVGHIAGPLPAARGLGQSTARNTRVEKSRERIAGGERHTIRAEYTLDMDVSGEKLTATVTMEAQFDIDPNIDQYAHPWGLQYAAKTGFEKLDRAIARAIPNRLPLRQVVTFSRQIAGGPVITDTLTIHARNVAEEDIPDGLFYAPDGYAYREPVFSFSEYGGLPPLSTKAAASRRTPKDLFIARNPRRSRHR